MKPYNFYWDSLVLFVSNCLLELVDRQAVGSRKPNHSDFLIMSEDSWKSLAAGIGIFILVLPYWKFSDGISSQIKPTRIFNENCSKLPYIGFLISFPNIS